MERDILKGLNFAGLPGNSTESPIHMLNMIMENAKEENRELWLLFQDMKKAFDLVPLESLELMLRKLKVLVITISYIMSLYKERQLKIITEYGLTEEITAGNSIDQGEVISPLMWRVFYDPLLDRVQNKTKLGYTVKLNIPAEAYCAIGKEIRQSAIAYADDTTWITNDKKQLEEIIKIVNEFFSMNDIQINGTKSKLIVINTKIPKEERKVIFGDAEVKVENEKVIVRALGIWLDSKMKETLIKNRVKGIVKQITEELK